MIRLPIIAASLLNILFLSFIVCLSLQEVQCDGKFVTRFKCFLQAPPNEIGDTLSGIFGSMTLIWVVASVFQQSMELRAQRAEFQIMADAQTAQVKALEAQAEIFRDERRRATEKFNAAKMNTEIRHVLQAFIERQPRLVVKLPGRPTETKDLLEKTLTVDLSTDGYRANDVELRHIVDAIIKVQNATDRDAELSAADVDTEELLSTLLQTLVTLAALRPEVSEIAVKRLSTMKIDAGLTSLHRLLERLRPLES